MNIKKHQHEVLVLFYVGQNAASFARFVKSAQCLLESFILPHSNAGH
jgi:hypothetical protein